MVMSFMLPAGEIRAAIGAEHRDEFLADDPDILVQEGWGPNQSQSTAGGYNVSSVYAELNVPVLKDLPGVESLTTDLSGRLDHYSTFGNATTYKFGVEYTPIEDVRFRGSISTGFRAPNVAELFGGTAISDLTASGDPCDTRAAGYNGNANVGTGRPDGRIDLFEGGGRRRRSHQLPVRQQQPDG
ncbi:MAG: TonB-dependent receptor [Steroidobacteraceae bacterium]